MLKLVRDLRHDLSKRQEEAESLHLQAANIERIIGEHLDKKGRGSIDDQACKEAGG